MSTVIYLSSGASYVVYLGGAQGIQGPAGILAAPTIVGLSGPITATLAWETFYELICTGGLMTLTFAAATTGVTWVKFMAGSPATHNIVLLPPSGKTIEGVLGAYNSSSPTIPGTYYSSLTFQTASDVGNALSFYVNSGGNIALSPL